jgi:hypothetical protein
MKTNKQTWNWIIDAGLLIGFFAAFFLDVTGLSLHQWLGVMLAAGAGIHMLFHWNWIKCVIKNFTSRVSARSKGYFVLDTNILIGFGLILVTGLVISSWLNLTLPGYDTWRDIHVVSSIGTLVLIVLKISLHGRCIINKILSLTGGSKAPAACGPVITTDSLQPVPVSKTVSRRQFLTMMGFVSLAAGLAISNVVAKKTDVQAETGEGGTNQTSAVSQPVSQATQPTASVPATQANTQVPGPVQPTDVPAVACTVRCNKGCSYPGRCRRYTDVNGNGKCDLGECV